MRKFGIKYAALHPQHLQVREAFTRVRTLADWQAALDRWYGEDARGCYPDPELHKSGDCEEAA
jgi:tRNA-dihydrouridine synthase B